MLKEARYMSLDRYAGTPIAKDYCLRIADELTMQEGRRRHRKPDDQKSFVVAIEAIVGDLLVSSTSEASPYCFRSMMNQSFVGETVRATTFRKVVTGLEKLGLIEIEKGGNHSRPFVASDVAQYDPGMATRFKCSDKMAFSAGDLFGAGITAHFPITPKLDLVTVRSSSVRQGAAKARGRIIRMPKTEELKAQRDRLWRLNSFLIEQDFGSIAFKGLYRGFNMGDEAGFNWNKGGRLYAHGDDNFQQFKKADRLGIQINGTPVAEIDINASYLTILLSMNGHSLPNRQDIYDIEGLPREVVKAWIRVALGAKSFSTRWPSSVVDELGGAKRKMKFKIKDVEEKILQEFPPLLDWPTSDMSWADLMFIESEAIYLSLERLAEQNIPALPVHDALLVPAEFETEAKLALRESFKIFTGVTPKLTVNVGKR